MRIEKCDQGHGRTISALTHELLLNQTILRLPDSTGSRLATKGYVSDVAASGSDGAQGFHFQILTGKRKLQTVAEDPGDTLDLDVLAANERKRFSSECDRVDPDSPRTHCAGGG